MFAGKTQIAYTAKPRPAMRRKAGENGCASPAAPQISAIPVSMMTGPGKGSQAGTIDKNGAGVTMWRTPAAA